LFAANVLRPVAVLRFLLRGLFGRSFQRATVLEELAQYLTGSKDETRDLQDWAFKLTLRVVMAEQCV
jgi:hypothetical protein